MTTCPKVSSSKFLIHRNTERHTHRDTDIHLLYIYIYTYLHPKKEVKKSQGDSSELIVEPSPHFYMHCAYNVLYIKRGQGCMAMVTLITLLTFLVEISVYMCIPTLLSNNSIWGKQQYASAKTEYKILSQHSVESCLHQNHSLYLPIAFYPCKLTIIHTFFIHCTFHLRFLPLPIQGFHQIYQPQLCGLPPFLSSCFIDLHCNFILTDFWASSLFYFKCDFTISFCDQLRLSYHLTKMKECS